jgi:hypothetical protein
MARTIAPLTLHYPAKISLMLRVAARVIEFSGEAKP